MINFFYRFFVMPAKIEKYKGFMHSFLFLTGSSIYHWLFFLDKRLLFL